MKHFFMIRHDHTSLRALQSQPSKTVISSVIKYNSDCFIKRETHSHCSRELVIALTKGQVRVVVRSSYKCVLLGMTLVRSAAYRHEPFYMQWRWSKKCNVITALLHFMSNGWNDHCAKNPDNHQQTTKSI